METKEQNPPDNKPQDSILEYPIPETLLSLDTPEVKSESPAILRAIKRWSWRATAVYIWIHIAIRIVTRHDPLSVFEKALVVKFIDALSGLGFAPVNTTYVMPVL